MMIVVKKTNQYKQWRYVARLFISLLMLTLLTPTSVTYAAEPVNSRTVIPLQGDQPNMAALLPVKHFLSLSDLHFDPFVSCRNTIPCPLIEKLRQADVSAWPMILTQSNLKGLPQYQQDSNYALVKLTLAHAKQVAMAQHAEFVLVMGDFLGHEFKSKYQKYSTDKKLIGYHQFLNKTLTLIAHELNNAFPNMDVFSVVGNNDSADNDYVSKPHGRFFKDMTVVWSSLIKNKKAKLAFKETFPMAGYYAVNVPTQPDLRLIVLNTNYFAMMNPEINKKIIHQAAQQELDWLHDQLSQLKANHQKALIIMHIPLSIDVYAYLRFHLFTLMTLWQEDDADRFQAEIKQFSDQISGILTSHLHSDWFQMLTVDESHVIPIIATPAVSTIFGNNPGFKVFGYSAKTLQLIDFITYYYPLVKENDGAMEHDFSGIYKPNCHACAMLANNANPQWSPFYWCAVDDKFSINKPLCE